MVRIGVFSFLTVLFPALIFSAALSAGVPSLETRSAADVSARQAVLRGSVNPNGARTTAWFEYGENGRFDNSAGVQPLGSETKNLSFTFTLAELRPDTTYYFRLAAVNEFGISRSQTLWFRTKAADSPATPRGPRAVTSGATEIGQFTARLYGSVEPKGLETGSNTGPPGPWARRRAIDIFPAATGPIIFPRAFPVFVPERFITIGWPRRTARA